MTAVPHVGVHNRAMANRVGIDLASAQGVREALEAHGSRYLERVYTDAEQRDCAGDPRRLAARFAAKEATVKVLRPGPGCAVPLRDIEVVRHPDGHTELLLSGLAADRAAAEGLVDLAVSLSHEGDLATAVVFGTSRALQPEADVADDG
jgi:holo-[acyl-carrier protein] synthase